MTNEADTIQNSNWERASLTAQGLQRNPHLPAKYSLVVALGSVAAGMVWALFALGVSLGNWNAYSAPILMAMFLLPIVAIVTGGIGLKSARRSPEEPPIGRTRSVAAAFAVIGLLLGILGTAFLLLVSAVSMSAF